MLERVQKIIANAGTCSRRRAEELILQGRVKVNGQIINIGAKADLYKDEITVEGKKIFRPKKIYLAFNKPIDCLTTLDDPQGRKTIFDYIKSKDRLIPVGRLDFKTEGLLFLTNDGEFANLVMHPRYEVEKSYVVALDREFSLEDIAKVKKGLDLEEIQSRPAKVRYAHPNKKMIEITIHEGQNRIVRRMMEALGYKVFRLIRIKIGNVMLGDVLPGKTRELSFSEVKQFKK